MNLEIFDKFPVLTSERLILREMLLEDVNGVFKFNSSLKNLEYVARDPFTKLEQAQEKLDFFISSFKKEEGIWWTFTLNGDNELIGYGGLFGIDKESNKAEIGYGLLDEYWGKGIVSEAIKIILDFGFNNLKLNKIFGKIVPGNTASEKILLNNGFVKEGILIDDEFAREKYFDMQIFSRIQK